MRDRALGSTIRLKFTTTDANGAPVAPSSAFTASDFRIYKDGSATEKTTTNGITVTSPFDSVTGRHLIEIDTSNSTGDVGFWASGSAYFVELNTAKTVNSQSVSGLEIGSFSLELQTADVRKNAGTLITSASGRQEVNVTHFGGTAGTFSGGRPEVNTTHWAGTAVGSVTINCNMTQISGDAIAADNAEAFFDGTGYAGTNNVIPTVTTLTNGVTVTTNNDKTGYSLTATTGLGNQTANITGNLSGSVGSVSGAVGSVTGNVGGNVVGSVGSVAGNVSGSVGSVAANGITAASLASDAGTELATAVWSALTTATWATDSFGAKVLIGENTNRTVKVTGSNHAAADVHEFQADVIDSDAIAASAVTEIQSGLATAAALTAVKAVTDKIDTGLVLDGAVYQFTANMLELAPAGGGGGGTDWTANERTAIRTILGIPGSGTTPADPTDGVLFDIKAKTDQIGSANAITSLLAGAVLDPGTITSFPETLVIGDSYQETDGREIQIPLVDTDGNVLTTVGSRNLADATATFEVRRINESDPTRVITGTATIVDPPGTGTGAGAPYAVVELPADETDKGLVGYRYKGKLTLTWSGPGTDVFSFDTATIKFTY